PAADLAFKLRRNQIAAIGTGGIGMRLLLDPAQRLFIATAHVTVKSLLVFDIGDRYAGAQRGARILDDILVKRLFLLIERAVDAVNLFAQQHIRISAFLDL